MFQHEIVLVPAAGDWAALAAFLDAKKNREGYDLLSFVSGQRQGLVGPAQAVFVCVLRRPAPAPEPEPEAVN